MASAQTQDQYDALEDIVKCAVCLRIYTDPKSLPCLHSFCLECLRSLAEVNPDRNEITCPMCKRIIELSGNGVTDLPNDFKSVQIIDIWKRANAISTAASTSTSDSATSSHDSIAILCREQLEEGASYLIYKLGKYKKFGDCVALIKETLRAEVAEEIKMVNNWAALLRSQIDSLEEECVSKILEKEQQFITTLPQNPEHEKSSLQELCEQLQRLVLSENAPEMVSETQEDALPRLIQEVTFNLPDLPREIPSLKFVPSENIDISGHFGHIQENMISLDPLQMWSDQLEQ